MEGLQCARPTRGRAPNNVCTVGGSGGIYHNIPQCPAGFAVANGLRRITPYCATHRGTRTRTRVLLPPTNKRSVHFVLHLWGLCSLDGLHVMCHPCCILGGNHDCSFVDVRFCNLYSPMVSRLFSFVNPGGIRPLALETKRRRDEDPFFFC